MGSKVSNRSGPMTKVETMRLPAVCYAVSRREWMRGATAGLLGVLVGGRAGSSELENVEDAIKRGVRWLLQQQAEDGGWHSDTYGNMRGGAGNTALVLAALSQRNGERGTDTQAAYERGVRFLTTNLERQGFAQPPADIADYPVSATALLLTALSRRPVAVAKEIKPRLCSALRIAQRGSANGWREAHPDFGGWGLTVDRDVESDPANPSNLTATACALTALQSHEALTPAVRQDALKFLGRCQRQKSDDEDFGGFAFTVRAEDSLNKAGWRRTAGGLSEARPYPSTTCDGVIALLACGVAADDTRVTSAIAWLIRNATADSAVLPKFRKGLAFYEAQALAHVCRLTVQPQLHEVHRRHVEMLLAGQEANGSWSNSHAEMREDDPLIATAFAILALAKIPAPVSEK